MFEKRRSEPIRKKVTHTGKRYKELGKVLDDLARSRDVRGPYNIACYAKDATGYEVSGQAVSKYLYGESLPKRAFVEAFSEAFELTEQERSLLAYTYTYGLTGSAPNYQAFRDPLTDLPNRTLFMSRPERKARHEVFEPGMDTRARERLELENDFRLAIEREKFVVLYQPKILLRSGEVVGMEALAYWEHPGRGLVPPSEFFPVMEGSHSILPIGRLLLREACQRARKWQEGHRNEAPLMVSVSLPARRFRQTSLVEEVAGLLRETGLNPRGLNLKVAEDVAMKDPRRTITTLRKLKSLGLQLTLGDFGVGRSSLAYLNRFPIGFLEIDRSLVGGLREGSTDALVVSGVISLAHALGLTASAEGAQTSDQVGQLRGVGCDLAWGGLLLGAALQRCRKGAFGKQPRNY